MYTRSFPYSGLIFWLADFWPGWLSGGRLGQNAFAVIFQEFSDFFCRVDQA
jgi:hypothetical protein